MTVKYYLRWGSRMRWRYPCCQLYRSMDPGDWVGRFLLEVTIVHYGDEPPPFLIKVQVSENLDGSSR